MSMYVSGDNISDIASQLAIQKWPGCYASLKCRATSYNYLSVLITYSCL